MTLYWSKDSKSHRLRLQYSEKTTEFRAILLASMVQKAEKTVPEAQTDKDERVSGSYKTAKDCCD